MKYQNLTFDEGLNNPSEITDTDFRAVHVAPSLCHSLVSVLILWKAVDEQTCSLYEIRKFKMCVTYK